MEEEEDTFFHKNLHYYDYYNNIAPVVFDLLPVVVSVVSVCAVVKACLSCAFGGTTVKVTCWFCHQPARVHRSAANSWNCRYCEQYNGFTEDGDYNKDLPQQRIEEYNPKSKAVRRRLIPRPPILCGICAHNQALKLQQRSLFEPSSEEKFEEEAARLERQLELTYRLCPPCDAAVREELAAQRNAMLVKRMRPLRPHETTVKINIEKTLIDRLFQAMRVVIVTLAVIFFLPKLGVLSTEIFLICIWLILYIIVYSSPSSVYPSFVSFILMSLALVVNIASESLYFYHLPTLYYYLSSHTMQSVIQLMRNPLFHTILYFLVLLLMPAYRSTTKISQAQLKEKRPINIAENRGTHDDILQSFGNTSFFGGSSSSSGSGSISSENIDIVGDSINRLSNISLGRVAPPVAERGSNLWFKRIFGRNSSTVDVRRPS